MSEQPQTTGDADIDFYLEQTRVEQQQSPESMRKALVRKRYSKFGQIVFNWNKSADDPSGYNYQPTRFEKRYDNKSAPVAGTNVRPSELTGIGGAANPDVDISGRLRERISKMKKDQL